MLFFHSPWGWHHFACPRLHDPLTEYKFLHALDTLYQSGASAAALDRRDRTTLVGSFSSGGVPSIGYSRGARPAQYPYAYSYPDRATWAARGSSTEEDGGHGGQPEQQECLGEDEDGPVERCVAWWCDLYGIAL